jgi:hypothetical protein
MRPALGWTAGPTQNFCISWGADDAIGPLSASPLVDTNAFRRAKNDYCFTLGSGASTTAPHIKLASFDSGGGGGATFTYENQNDTSTYDIYYLALGGSDITNVKAGSFIPNATLGNQDITWSDPAFQPDIVFFMGANTPTPTPGTTSVPNAQWFFGAAKSSTAQGVSTGLSMDGRTDRTYAARHQRADRCISFLEESNTTAYTVDCGASYVQPLSNGFRINITNAPTVTQEPIFYLAIKGGSWNVGSFLQPATTGNQVINTPTAHTPKGVFLWSIAQEALTTPSNDHRYVFGACSSPSVSGEAVTLSGGDSNNVTTTQSARGTAASAGKVFRSIREEADGTLSDVTGEATLADSVGGTAARQILYVTAGDSPAATTLIKFPATTPEVTEIAEAAPIHLKVMVKNLASPETVNLSELTPIIKTLGKVRVVGGVYPPGAGPTTTGFTEEGFLDTGFTSVPEEPSTTTSDFIANDFVEADFKVDYEIEALEFPPETTTISESVSKFLSTDISLVAVGDLLLRFSGGASYNGNSNGGVGSLGGAISVHAVTSGAMNSAWDDVLFSEATAGDTEVRCYYLYNAHPTLDVYDVDVWLEQNTPAGDIIEIGAGTAGVNGTESTVANENTLPAGVDFSVATDPGSAIHLGNIPSEGSIPIWIKRHVPAGTPSWNENEYTIRISFVSDHL